MNPLILNYSEMNFCIYGLGATGDSVVNYFKRKKFSRYVVWDDKIKKKKHQKFFSKYLDYADYIVLSPGINIKKCKLKKYLFKNEKKIISELDIFYLNFPKNIKITITGTNGKSTTCQMLYNIFNSNKLDVRLVGNIGNSPLSELKIKKKLLTHQ